MKNTSTFQKLLKGGHSTDRATEIILEAMASSNPEYILHYYGVRNFTDKELAILSTYTQK